MNYITKIQADNQELKARLAEINQEISSLMAYLQSEKFCCGDELDGYVSTRDVLPRLLEIRSKTI